MPIARRQDHLPEVLNDNGLCCARRTRALCDWITPEGMPNRFDTWFFLAAAPPEQAGAHDGKESTDSIRVPPREALDGGENGRWSCRPDHAEPDSGSASRRASRPRSTRNLQGDGRRRADTNHDEAQRRPAAPRPPGSQLLDGECSSSSTVGSASFSLRHFKQFAPRDEQSHHSMRNKEYSIRNTAGFRLAYSRMSALWTKMRT